jgi:hypothetical protein
MTCLDSNRSEQIVRLFLATARRLDQPLTCCDASKQAVLLADAAQLLRATGNPDAS